MASSQHVGHDNDDGNNVVVVAVLDADDKDAVEVVETTQWIPLIRPGLGEDMTRESCTCTHVGRGPSFPLELRRSPSYFVSRVQVFRDLPSSHDHQPLVVCVCAQCAIMLLGWARLFWTQFEHPEMCQVWGMHINCDVQLSRPFSSSAQVILSQMTSMMSGASVHWVIGTGWHK